MFRSWCHRIIVDHWCCSAQAKIPCSCSVDERGKMWKTDMWQFGLCQQLHGATNKMRLSYLFLLFICPWRNSIHGTVSFSSHDSTSTPGAPDLVWFSLFDNLMYWSLHNFHSLGVMSSTEKTTFRSVYFYMQSLYCPQRNSVSLFIYTKDHSCVFIYCVVWQKLNSHTIYSMNYSNLSKDWSSVLIIWVKVMRDIKKLRMMTYILHKSTLIEICW